MNGLSAMGCGLLGFGAVFLVIPAIIALVPRAWLNRGQELHHTHRLPVPRFGGLALVLAFLCVEGCLAAFLPDQRANVLGRREIVFGSVAMFALGFIDDILRLGAKRKLAGQLLIALGVFWCGIRIETFKIPFTEEIIALHGWGVLATVLWIVGITNLLNLIDGMDGLAGGVGFMLMALLVYVGMNHDTFVLVTASMAGALLAFLWFNFPPARVYLGDGGAYFIGFQLAIFSMVGSHKGTVVAALIAPLFVLALPILDTSIAILRRGLNGLPVFRADRGHIHHRLLRLGMSRRRVILWLYSLTLVFLMVGLAAFWSRDQLIPVLFGVVMLALMICAGKLSLIREWFTASQAAGTSPAIREQIHYARSLTTWLAREAKRCDSLENFYKDLVFVARRLGFTTVKVAMAGRERSWGQVVPCCEVRRFRHALKGATPGLLELHAPTCNRPHSDLETVAAGAEWDEKRVAQANPHSYEVMADLLVETWQQALTRPWHELESLWPEGSTAIMKAPTPEETQFQPNRQTTRICTPLPIRDDSAAA